jgi:hypothetical protein
VLDAIVNEKMIQQVDVRGLMFHDVADNVTPIEHSRPIAIVCKNAQFI